MRSLIAVLALALCSGCYHQHRDLKGEVPFCEVGKVEDTKTGIVIYTYTGVRGQTVLIAHDPKTGALVASGNLDAESWKILRDTVVKVTE